MTKSEERLALLEAMKEFRSKKGRIKKLGWYFNKFQFNDKLDDVTWEEGSRGIVKANELKA